MGFSGNTATIATSNGGTGAVRPIFIGNSTNGLTIDTASATKKFGLTIDSGVAGVNIFNVSGQLLGSSGAAQASIAVTPTINQSGSGSYTALLINPTETATGSGTKRLIDAQVSGTSKFSVDNTGKGQVGCISDQRGYFANPGVIVSCGNAGRHLLGLQLLYVCTATNTWKRAALSTW